MRKILLRPRAQLDLESIFIHVSITLGVPNAARDIIGELYAAFERAADMPTLGMVFGSDELEGEYRRILAKSYWIYYTFDDDNLIVWRIFHTRQDIETHTLMEF